MYGNVKITAKEYSVLTGVDPKTAKKLYDKIKELEDLQKSKGIEVATLLKYVKRPLEERIGQAGKIFKSQVLASEIVHCPKCELKRKACTAHRLYFIAMSPEDNKRLMEMWARNYGEIKIENY